MEPFKEKETSNKLTYYFDALCGWCYGFSPVVSKLAETYSDQVEFEVISGGLFSGNRVGKVNEIAPYIKNGAYKIVEERTGVTFGEGFLKDIFGEEKIILNSLPPAMALCIIKEESPANQLKFAEILLKAVYFDGLNPEDKDGLASYATQIGFDKESFRLKLENDKYKNAVINEYQRFTASQYSAMPALVMEKDGGQIPLSRGYMDYESLKTRIDGLLLQTAEK